MGYGGYDEAYKKLSKEYNELAEKLQTAERMAELLKNKAWNFKDATFRIDACELVDAWYGVDKNGEQQ